MLIPQPLFKNYQFVQKIEFKNKDKNRPDLGLDYVGFITSSHIVERYYTEYDIVFANASESSVLEYSLRALSDEEVEERLNEMMQEPEKYHDFIEAINQEAQLEKYHQSLTFTTEIPLQMIFE